MLSLSSASLSLVAPTAPVVRGAARASVVTMKGSEIVLADKEVEGKIMAVVASEPMKTKSAALCSQMAAANLGRIK